MSKGKRKQGKQKIIRVKKKQPKDALNPLAEADVPPNLRPMVEGLKQGFERRVRYSELKSLHQHQKLVEMINEISANQVVLQTLLMENKIVDQRKFAEEYRRYFTEVIGIVESGQMKGYVAVDTFNIGVPFVPNSITELRDKGKNPVIINRS